MRPGISAVGFDLDGTLYPNYDLYRRLIPFILSELHLMKAFGKTRDIFHESPEHGYPQSDTAQQCTIGRGRELAKKIAGVNRDFYTDQAVVTADMLGADAEYVRNKLEVSVYRGWEPHFRKIKLYRGVRQALDAFKAGGLKLGLLSDFPPEIKIKHLGLDAYWDAVLCTEVVGALKPDPLSFIKLAQALDTEPSRILYVGNSYRYDIVGAKQAGMYAALIDRRPLRLPLRDASGKNSCKPDFVFRDYRQLINFMLS